MGKKLSDNADRDKVDPLIDSSDHWAFHEQGYPAVLVIEDLCWNRPNEPPPDPNPDYHTAKDTWIDANYGAAIASAIACTVRELADDAPFRPQP